MRLRWEYGRTTTVPGSVLRPSPASADNGRRAVRGSCSGKGEGTMTVYSGPVFDMAVNQFGVIANHLEIPMDERDRLLLPKRAVTVSCPIHRDDGSVAVFEGYRVQHHLTLGPTKGGTRFAPIGRYRRGRGAGDLDELEMRAGRPALWRRQGRRHRRSHDDFQARTRSAVAPLHAGDDPVRRPAYRRDGAGHGHQRAGDGLVHGHLLDVSGPHRDRDRHRQAGRPRAARSAGARPPAAASPISPDAC